MYSKSIIKKVSKVLIENKVNYWNGNQCKKFEKEFSKYIDNKYSITF